MFMHLFKNLFHAAIIKKSQKCNKTKMEQWIKKILKNAPYLEESSHKKAKKREENMDFVKSPFKMRFFIVNHSVKSARIRRFFGSVFSCIRTKYRSEKPPYWDVFHAVNVIRKIITAFCW